MTKTGGVVDTFERKAAVFEKLARSLHELGASEVSAGEFSATFPAPVRAVVLPPKDTKEPPRQGTAEDTAESRQAYRDHVMGVLNG